MASLKALNTNDYQIGWITALPIERAAATALLDERHTQPVDFVQHHADQNSYTWGRISHHNIVIASLVSGVYGTTSATTTALGLISSFPAIKAGILVGIGAGVPESGLDIRLGDIAVSVPNGIYGGVVQYDTGKAKEGNIWERTGVMTTPPLVLLNALAKLRAESELEDSSIPAILNAAYHKNLKFGENFKHPGSHVDRGPHLVGPKERPNRASTAPEVHYGTIASGNKLVKDSSIRQEIFEIVGPSCICIEMEAGGLMNNFPCLVIRGICDYADSRKNDVWQRYASATAAAFAKELLYHVPHGEIDRSRRIEDTISEVNTVVHQLKAQIELSEKKQDEERISKLLQALYTCPYADRKNRNRQRAADTCEWFTSHQLYSEWLNGTESNLLWVSADPGCGKSVLARFLVDEQLRANGRTICYFFFRDDFEDQRSSSAAACALLRQALDQKRHLISKSILNRFDGAGAKFAQSFEDVWGTFLSVLAHKDAGEIFIVLDALDECQNNDRHQLIGAILRLQSTRQNDIKVLMTSRPYHQIKDHLYGVNNIPVIHLSGESDEERDMITKEIDIVIRHRIHDFSAKRKLTEVEYDFLLEKLTAIPQRTYLWVHLTMEIIEETPGFTRYQARKACEDLPASVDEAYEKILSRISDQAKAKLLLQCIVASRRPLSPSELSLFLVANEYLSVETLEEQMEPQERFRTTVRDTCGLFVIIVDGLIYLLHQTVREFLLAKELSSSSLESDTLGAWKWKHSLELRAANRILAERCLWILRSNFQSALENGAYAVYWWVEHFTTSDIIISDRTVQLATEFCAGGFGRTREWIVEYNDFHRTKRIAKYVTEFPMVLASCLGLAPVVEQMLISGLMKAGDLDTKATCLILGTFYNHREVAEILLRHGTDPNGFESRSSSNSWGNKLYKFVESPLHEAVRHCDIVLQKLLLDYGGNPNRLGINNRRPLHNAALFSRIRMARMLVHHGAARDAEDSKYRTPMHYYCGLTHEIKYHCKSTCYDILEVLWDHSTSFLNKADYKGKTCLHYASRYGCKACASFLIRSGAAIESPSQNGLTPLFEASCSNSVSVARLLLDAGAEVDATDYGKLTPLMMAVQPTNSSATMVRLLLENGANILAKNANGTQCIHLVRNVAALEVLLEYGADINSRNVKGKTPLMYVCQNYDWRWGEEQQYNVYAKMVASGADTTLRDLAGRQANWMGNIAFATG